MNPNHSLSMEKLFIEKLHCWAGTSILSIYPGLLPYFWRVWKVSPHKQLACNLTEPKSLLFDFHIYVTVVLHLSTVEQVEVNMSFVLEEQAMANMKHSGFQEDRVYSDKTFNSLYSVAYGLIES